VARLAGFRHRRSRRHGLPYHQYRLHGPGAVRPESVEVLDTSGIVDHETYPLWSIIRTQFGPRNGRGPLSLTWYDGGEKFPEGKKVYKELLYGEKVPESGLLLVGEKGSYFSHNDYGDEHVLLPREKFKDCPKPKPTLPRSPGHFTEFVKAIKAGDPSMAMSNFDYAGRLTETVLLGTVALKAGTKIEWDAHGLRARHSSAADQYLRRHYRNGYTIHA
jgi:hypothetical protein